MPLKFDHADSQRMLTIQREVTAVLVPHAHATEAALAIFALLRCARVLLRLYPAPTKRELISLICDYIENEDTPPGPTSPLWLPTSPGDDGRQH